MQLNLRNVLLKYDIFLPVHPVYNNTDITMVKCLLKVKPVKCTEAEQKT